MNVLNQVKFILILITISTVISCSNKNNSDEKILNAIVESQKQLNILQYKVHRIDTLISGEVLQTSGQVTLQKNLYDTLHEISFYAKTDSTEWENYYINYTYYELSSKIKLYKLKQDFGHSILSTDGGQLIVPELLDLGIKDSKLSVNKRKNHIELLIERSIGLSVLTKIFKIDTSSLIPFEITRIMLDKQQNISYSSSWILKDILVNEEIVRNELDNPKFTSGYAHTVSAKPDNSYKLIGTEIPDLNLDSFNDEKFNLRGFEAKVVLLDFWEWWCGPCLASLPKVNNIAKTYESYGVIAIGIASDHPEKAKAIIKKKGLRFQQLMGNDELKSKFYVTSFPRYILIDQNGIIRKIYRGYSENMEKDLNELIIQNLW